MKDSKYVIVEHGYTWVGEFYDEKIAHEICDTLNTKKKGKKEIYIHRFKVISLPPKTIKGGVENVNN